MEKERASLLVIEKIKATLRLIEIESMSLPEKEADFYMQMFMDEAFALLREIQSKRNREEME